MSTLEQMQERCDQCSDPLEIGQIGTCDSRRQPEAVDALAVVEQVCVDHEGNGIYSVGANAALRAMAHHWKDHLAEGHPADEILPADIDGAIEQLVMLRNELATRLGAPADDTPTLPQLLAAGVAGLGDIFTDARECRHSVAAAQNLVELAKKLSSTSEIAIQGTLRRDGVGVITLPIRADGTLVIEDRFAHDLVPGKWTVKLPTGEELPLYLNLNDEGQPIFVIDDANAFYAALAR